MRDWKQTTGLCELCHEQPAAEWHHLFSKTKKNKMLYGALIHSPKNLLAVCHGCHEYAKHISEKEFCRRLGIETRSKSGKL